MIQKDWPASGRGDQPLSTHSESAFLGALEGLEQQGFELMSSRHKPLTLLWAMGRLVRTGERLIPWHTFRIQTEALLVRYGQPLPDPDPQYPFWDLTVSPLWEFVSKSPNPRAPYSPPVSWLNRHDPSAGLTVGTAALLADKRVLDAAVESLVDRFLLDVVDDDFYRLLGLSDDGPPSPPRPTHAGTETSTASSHRRAGYLADAKLRRALESYALAQATTFYEREGWDVDDVGAFRPYDLQLTRRADRAVRHVEVKGSSLGVDDVELTIGEVSHSRGVVACDLFVVSGIAFSPTDSGEFHVSGGQARLWRNWQAEEADLTPTRFRYRLPAGNQEAEISEPSVSLPHPA